MTMKNAVTFRSEEHRIRFIQVIQTIGKNSPDDGGDDGPIDPEYGSALYLLTSDLTVWTKVSSYVHPYMIDFATIEEEVGLSDEALILLKVAWNLFNGDAHVDPLKLAELSEYHLLLIIPAIVLRQGQCILSDL